MLRLIETGPMDYSTVRFALMAAAYNDTFKSLTWMFAGGSTASSF